MDEEKIIQAIARELGSRFPRPDNPLEAKREQARFWDVSRRSWQAAKKEMERQGMVMIQETRVEQVITIPITPYSGPQRR